MIKAKPCAFEDFPPSKIDAPGVKSLKADFSERSVHLHRNVPYAIKSGTTLHMDIIEPEQRTGEGLFPLIVYVQGSAWMEQNLGQETGQLARFAQRGYVIAVVQYRPSSTAPFPAQIKDVKTAAAYLAKNAGAYHADPSKMAIWGDSSGGHTALMCAVTGHDPAFSDAGTGAFSFSGAVDFYGPTDISKMNEEPSVQDHISPDSPEGLLIGGKHVLENPLLAQPTVVMNFVKKDKKIPPLLIFHGDKDRLVPFGQSVMLYKKLKREGKDAAFYKIAGADHGGPPFWSKEVMDIIDAFFIKLFS